MNEENAVNEMNEDMGGEAADIPHEEPENGSAVQALEEQVAALTAENTMLRSRLFCESEGIPNELAEDIICAASARAGENMSFEEAVREIYGRISKFGGSERKISTGVRSRRETSGDNALRRAFGLK